MFVTVDQVTFIGALPLAVARDLGCPVAYLPGLTMRRIADLYPGEAKTDARDAARAMPHTLQSVDFNDETIAELQVIVAFETTSPPRQTATPTDCGGCSTSPPAPGTRHRPPHAAPRRAQVPGPARLPGADPQGRTPAPGHPNSPQGAQEAERLIDDIFTALDEQTVVAPGTDAAALIVPSLTAVLDQHKLLAAHWIENCWKPSLFPKS